MPLRRPTAGEQALAEWLLENPASGRLSPSALSVLPDPTGLVGDGLEWGLTMNCYAYVLPHTSDRRVMWINPGALASVDGRDGVLLPNLYRESDVVSALLADGLVAANAVPAGAPRDRWAAALLMSAPEAVQGEYHLRCEMDTASWSDKPGLQGPRRLPMESGDRLTAPDDVDGTTVHFAGFFWIPATLDVF